MSRIKEMFYDTPSGNITINFIEEWSELKSYKKTTHIEKKIIHLDIDDVRDLFKKTKEFLDWYDKGLRKMKVEKKKKNRWYPFKRIREQIRVLKSLSRIGELDD